MHAYHKMSGAHTLIQNSYVFNTPSCDFFVCIYELCSVIVGFVCWKVNERKTHAIGWIQYFCVRARAVSHTHTHPTRAWLMEWNVYEQRDARFVKMTVAIRMTTRALSRVNNIFTVKWQYQWSVARTSPITPSTTLSIYSTNSELCSFICFGHVLDFTRMRIASIMQSFSCSATESWHEWRTKCYWIACERLKKFIRFGNRNDLIGCDIRIEHGEQLGGPTRRYVRRGRLNNDACFFFT